MKTHYALSDITFESQFKNATLEPTLFTHEAHIRLAWILIKKYGVDRAADNLCKQIAVFDAKFGDGTKFNKTVTVAAVKAVDHFMEKTPANTFADFIQVNPRLIFNFKELLSYHYSQDIFNNQIAKRDYVEPDLAAF